MNMHKNTNKQGEKILLSGVAAAALGLINAKPRAVKAATLNGNRATKKMTRRTVKTKLNYQTEMDSETAGETATADPANQDSGSQTKVSTTTGQDQSSAALTSNNDHDSVSASDNKTTTERFDPAKATRDENSTTPTWDDVPIEFTNGTLKVGLANNEYTITKNDGEYGGFSQKGNIKNIDLNPSSVKEIDFVGKIHFVGNANRLFSDLTNLTTINGLENFDTTKITNMSSMFYNCSSLKSLDLSTFSNKSIDHDQYSMLSMFANCTSLEKLNIRYFTTPGGDNSLSYWFEGDKNLRQITIGPDCSHLTYTSLETEGSWVNMGIDGPAKRGTNRFSDSDDFINSMFSPMQYDTYVCFANLGGDITIKYRDQDGNEISGVSNDTNCGNKGDKLINDDPITTFKPKETIKDSSGTVYTLDHAEQNNSPVTLGDVTYSADPQTITLVYKKSSNDPGSGSTTTDYMWGKVPVTFDEATGTLTVKEGELAPNSAISLPGIPLDIGIQAKLSNIANKIKQINIVGTVKVKQTAFNLFGSLPNLTTITGLEKLDITDPSVTSISQLFSNDPKLTTISGLEKSDSTKFVTSNITDMSALFSKSSALTKLDLSNMDMSKVTNFQKMFENCTGLNQLVLGKNTKFSPDNSGLTNSGKWINMGVDQDSPAKGTNKWTSDELMTNYQGDRDHDTYVRYTGGIVTIHRQDEDGKQLVDQDGKQIPDEKLFGNISDPVTVDTSKEFAGYTFKENKNSNVKAFTSDPQDITLVYSKSKTDNTSDNTWEGVPYTFNNGVLSLGVKGINYTIDNSGNKEKSYALDTRDISLSQNIKGVNVDEIKEIDLNANIAIIGSANGLFKNLKNLATIKGLSNLDTSQVTDFSLMFSGDTALTSADLSNFQVADTAAAMTDMFSSCSSLTKLTLGTGFMFTTLDNQPNNSLQQPGTWVNMGAGEGSPAKGTNQWTSADLITNYHGDTNHDIYVRFTNLGGKITINYRDQDGKEIPGVPAEVNFGNENDKLINDDPVTTFKLKDTLKDSSGTEYQFDHAVQNNSRITLSDVTYSASANPQDITLVYTKKTGTGSNGSGSNGSGSNGSGSNGSGSNGSGNSTPNTSVPNNTNSSSGNNGSVNNPSSSNSQGSNSQGSNTGNSNNNSSSASNGQNNGNNLPNNEPNNIPSPVNRKPKTVKPHKTINKGFNIKDQNAIHNQQLANSLKNSGSSSNAQNSASNTLPQTGNDKHNSLAMLALGSLALATALGAAWFGRKKD
ncbi:BspA family leucine-rich repeat surface protein [Lactobacillus sp. IBH004]|uniref:BspA family leucine-rich repeat surface protein n=1 Tax=Lactobacillus sp. IBH004 TaxID=2879107 RepID=UPI002242D49B|nr:BspA family leucine-rich repeat surface protein [Lactobacillus sp. IBH004]UZN42448.1 BspA family leucine-rich repeat surface protein [Lactobacillus sp. IBH004]